MKILRLCALILTLALLAASGGACAEECVPFNANELPCAIEVDLVNQIVTVYRGEGRENTDIARQMICSSGTDTPLGSYTMPKVRKEDEREVWYYIGKFRLHVQWASRIVDDILFHSLPSEEQALSPTMDSVEALGTPASHGCIRLRPADARWIAENCPPGTHVRLFDDAAPDEALRALLLVSSFCRDAMDYSRFLEGEILLSISSISPRVAAMQEKLISLGYVLPETDGFFGADTHRVVTQWQRDNGMEPTGELKPEDYAALMACETTPGIYRYGRVKVKNSLNLRQEPNSKSRVLDCLRKNSFVRVLEEENGWCLVEYGANTGYIAAKYVHYTQSNTEVN